MDIVENFKENLAKDLRAVFSSIPIVGQLSHCSKVHLREAAYEVGCIILFSTLPLWFFPSISAIIYIKDFDVSEFISQGELFIYAASFCGTMVYIISKQYGQFQRATELGSGPPLGVTIRFPYGGLFVTTSAIICMISAAAFFSLRTFDEFRGSSALSLDLGGVRILSWALFVVSTVLFYCATAYRNLIDTAGGYRAEPADDILNEWKASK